MVIVRSGVDRALSISSALPSVEGAGLMLNLPVMSDAATPVLLNWWVPARRMTMARLLPWMVVVRSLNFTPLPATICFFTAATGSLAAGAAYPGPAAMSVAADAKASPVMMRFISNALVS